MHSLKDRARLPTEAHRGRGRAGVGECRGASARKAATLSPPRDLGTTAAGARVLG